MSEQSISEQSARFAIDVAIEYGRRGINKPPSDDHWLMPYWQIGRDLSSSQQVREEALMDLQYVAGFKAGWNAQLDGDEEAMARMLERTTEALRALKSTPASPSQPSSVAMTDEQIKSIANANGHPVEGFYVAFFENDLIWFARRLLLQSSPKGASTGTEREQHDKWFYSEYPQADRIPKGEHRMSLNGWIAGRSSQPSAASGREWTQAELCELLPPDVMWQDNLTPELLRYVLSRAALTGAAPADANVGGLLRALREAQDALTLLSRNMAGKRWMPSDVAIVQDALRAIINAPIVPEPSAPADKVDAELTRLREIAYLIGSIYVHGNFKAETTNERELENLLRKQGTFWDSLADFDAAIDRMRSEDGKGGKL